MECLVCGSWEGHRTWWGTQPVGYMDLYVLLSNPVRFLTLLRMLISLFLTELVVSLGIDLNVFWLSKLLDLFM